MLKRNTTFSRITFTPVEKQAIDSIFASCPDEMKGYCIEKEMGTQPSKVPYGHPKAKAATKNAPSPLDIIGAGGLDLNQVCWV